MLQGTPSEELDRIIAAASRAQAELQRMREGIVPDDHGVVTVTADAAAERSARLRDEFATLVDVGRSLASSVDDLHPQTSGTYDALGVVVDRLEARIDRASVGHSGDELASAETEEPASVPVEITVADEDRQGPSYYGV